MLELSASLQPGNWVQHSQVSRTESLRHLLELTAYRIQFLKPDGQVVLSTDAAVLCFLLGTPPFPK